MEYRLMGSSKKVIDGLRDAVSGNITRVHIDGKVWVRHDADKIVDIYRQRDIAISDARLLAHALKGTAFDRNTMTEEECVEVRREIEEKIAEYTRR